MKRPPFFLGIGAQRAGTTWLDSFLRTHPALWLPTRRKELHYFDEHYDRGPDWYDGFFEDAPADAVLGEITPRYLFDPRVPERIARDLPEARLIVLLREPVLRAYSQYALTVRDEAFAGTFQAFLAERPDALARGQYFEQLTRFERHFPRERMCVLVFEEAVKDLERTAQRMADFLGLDPGGFEREALRTQRNAGGRVRFAKSYATARRVGEWLREHDLDGPVNAAKRLGLARLFGSKEALDPLEPRLHEELRGHFAEDMRGLEMHFGLDLGPWRPETRNELSAPNG